MPDLLAAHNMPFAVALALLALLALVQALGLGGFLDSDLDADGASSVDIGGGLASLVGLGQVPLLVWLSSFLASFALIGLAIQHFVEGLLGSPFGPAGASGAALLGAVPVNAVAMRALGAIWPHDETTAVDIGSLVGRRGRISIGTAVRGSPARAAVTDMHGHSHNVMVEPHDDAAAFREGDEVLLVRREGELFYALDGEGPIRLGR